MSSVAVERRRQLALMCERGAVALEAEAVEIDATDPERAGRKRRAAVGVREYAGRVRSGAAGSVMQAELVAHAALLGGVLVRAGLLSAAQRRVVEALVGDGVMCLVERPGQVAYYALAGYVPLAV